VTDTENTEKSLTTEKVKEISLPAAVPAIAVARDGKTVLVAIGGRRVSFSPQRGEGRGEGWERPRSLL